MSSLSSYLYTTKVGQRHSTADLRPQGHRLARRIQGDVGVHGAPVFRQTGKRLKCVHISTGSHNVSTTMTIRLEPDVKERLDRLAAATDRSKSFLAAEAVRAYVENNEWQIEEIRTALDEADAEDFARDKDVAKLARKWKVNAG